MRDLKTVGKTVISKSFAVSKIVHLALINTVPIFTAEQLNIIKKELYFLSKKIKNRTLYPK